MDEIVVLDKIRPIRQYLRNTLLVLLVLKDHKGLETLQGCKDYISKARKFQEHYLKESLDD